MLLRRPYLSFLLLALPTCLTAQSVVISQIYGGGGNSGATYKNDYIEVFNAGTSVVDISTWSVQYASSTGSSWQVTKLTGTLAPGQYYLVEESAGAAGTVDLPTPDATGSIALSATSGKIALVKSQTALTVSCPTSTAYADFVGFGTAANCSETNPTATLANATAALRNDNGCTDTNNNAFDFTVGAPNPRNSASTSNSCQSAPGLDITTNSLPAGTINVPYLATVSATGGNGTRTWHASGLPSGLAIDGGAGTISGTPSVSGTFPFTVTVTDLTGTATANLSLVIGDPATCTGAIQIGQIQGTADASPLVGQTVVTSGIVTGLRSNGFFLQSPAPGDSNPATSDGVFIFTSSAPTSAATTGNLVCVTGTVAEFQGQTELTTPTVGTLAIGQTLPSPVTLTTTDLNPNGPLDLLEKYSGMRVTVPSLTVTGPTDGTIDEHNATSTSSGQFYGVLTGEPRPFRAPGIALTDILPAGTPPNVPRWNTNPQIITVYGPGQVGATPINVTAGATVTGLTGILGYFPSEYEIYPDPSSSTSVGISGNITYTAVPDKTATEITVASTNMERFYNTYQDPIGPGTVTTLTPQAFANRLNKASLGIRNVLKTPDIIAVEEMEDLLTLQALASKINTDALAATGVNPGYTAYLAEGNDISNINVGFLIQSNVTVVDVTQYGKDTTFVSPTTQGTLLLNDRPPLVLRARVGKSGSTQTLPLTVIAVHSRSLDSIDDPPTGAQVRAKRQLQAEFLANLIQARQAADPNEKIVALGDYNSFQFNDGYVDVVGTVKGTPAPADQVVLASNALVSPALTDMVGLAPLDQRYSYTFSGSAQEIDQTLLNAPALAIVSRYAVGRLNADFPEIYRNDPNRPERVSDHDWPELYLTFPAAGTPSLTDVSSRMSIVSTGLAYSRISKQYTVTVTITNTSATAINGPLQLAINNLPAGEILANASDANGHYITALASGQLASGASVNVTVRILAPTTSSPSYTSLVYSGTF